MRIKIVTSLVPAILEAGTIFRNGYCEYFNNFIENSFSMGIK